MLDMLTRKSVLERVLDTVDLAPIDENEKLRLDDEIKRLRRQRESLFGFEELAKDELNEVIQDLEDKRKRIDNTLKFQGHPIVDMSVLTWRKGVFPLLALFSLNETSVSFTVDNSWRHERYNEPNYPRKILGYYDDVFSFLDERAWGRKITMYTSYSGLIPEETRAKINHAISLYKNHIYIMAEPKWIIKKEPRPVSAWMGDPLVVGFDGTDLRLIDHFDMTSLERLVASEFTS